MARRASPGLLHRRVCVLRRRTRRGGHRHQQWHFPVRSGAHADAGGGRARAGAGAGAGAGAVAFRRYPGHAAPLCDRPQFVAVRAGPSHGVGGWARRPGAPHSRRADLSGARHTARRVHGARKVRPPLCWAYACEFWVEPCGLSVGTAKSVFNGVRLCVWFVNVPRPAPTHDRRALAAPRRVFRWPPQEARPLGL
jgi:hypothetical protein